MKILFFVLNKVEKLNPLLNEFAKQDVKGATILSSHGMAHSLIESDDDHAFVSLRNYLDPKRKESKTIVMVIEDNEVEKIVNIIESIVGNLNKPDTGIVFTTPIDYVRGLMH
ncbi:MAG: hypothetical protein SOU07_07545 [Bacilli bacterium]|mgnify:FL=1|nr:hypothetical protein [Acholeplasmataceae bacterium]MDY2903274.1 hypothetical protein [Bacilli bacterium]